MKGGAENRKKTITAGALGAVALCCVLYAYNALFGGSSPPPPSASGTPAASTGTGGARTSNRTSRASGQDTANGAGIGAAAGVAAQRMASTSASLDPTLDESAMLRTENLVYSGSGRNIFSSSYTAPTVALPRNVPSARPRSTAPVYTPPPGPPPPPPINLKFFGTETRSNGLRQVFLLGGDDVYLAAQGDIVARKYKIVSISAGSIQVEDLVNNNTQTLPLQTQ